jgi:hypothetical protein
LKSFWQIFGNLIGAGVLIWLACAACAPAPTATPFVPPTRVVAAPTATPDLLPTLPPIPTPVPSTVTPEPTLPPSPTPVCDNNLIFVRDETIPDGTVFNGGERLDKQWRVRNAGTCNWDARYRLQWVAGDLLGAANAQALYPALAGEEALLQIEFIAPLEAGVHQSAWQAHAPDGTPFGERVFISIIVSESGTPAP